MQIKTRQRVRDLAEVYTHLREVTAMLDLVPDMFPSVKDPSNTDRKFFEPSAGSGNFLEEILRRKIAFVTADRYRTTMLYEHRLLRALASIYAIDIDPENVAESKDRLKHVLQSHLENDLNTKVPTPGFASAVDAILETNIIRANTLTDLDSIENDMWANGQVGTDKWWDLQDAQNEAQYDTQWAIDDAQSDAQAEQWAIDDGLLDDRLHLLEVSNEVSLNLNCVTTGIAERTLVVSSEHLVARNADVNAVVQIAVQGVLQGVHIWHQRAMGLDPSAPDGQEEPS